MEAVRTGVVAAVECPEVRFNDGERAFRRNVRRGSGVCALAPRLSTRSFFHHPSKFAALHVTETGLRRLSTCRVSHARFSLSHALQLYVQKSSSHVQILHRMSKRIFLANHLYTNPSLEQRAVSIADQTQVHLRLPPATVQQSHATQQQSGWLIDLIRFVSGSLRRQQFRLGCPR
jgi:hypothetical protein